MLICHALIEFNYAKRKIKKDNSPIINCLISDIPAAIYILVMDSKLLLVLIMFSISHKILKNKVSYELKTIIRRAL
ncbi:hypothetical protein Calab_3162 [Caldithrix abyssi DSM 13497]|uniref:Uncharacterized protein n=1 Tax=Caldithrix abyssi DSM 13497 TaxID=880073 RepID=H1XUE2_CALAY|nr:hypothetical protein Calab_3162 [Caldithrix abyssi DSM 13497]